MQARWKAFKILKDVCLEKRYSNLALKEEMDDLSDLDKGFVTNIVYGTLQNHRYLRYMWDNFPHEMPYEDICLLIDMSVYQMFFMDKVPDYAIVNEAVEISKSLYDGTFETFVNAILHNVLRTGRRVIGGNEVDRLAIRYSFPVWVIKMWRKQYGVEKTNQICEGLHRIPTQCARVNTLKSSVEEVLAQYPGFERGTLSEDALLYTQGNIAGTEAFKKGLVTVQDESAQLVAHLLDAQEEDVVLDMCAAPGSKTTHVGAMMRNKGILMALDIHKHRVELIKKTARRMGIICIEAMCADATDLSDVFERASFDRILLDGPCSGYGVIARKNDIKYHMKTTDMDGCIELQRELLDSAVLYLKKDGILVYSTCTLNKKENEKQVEAFLQRHKNFTLCEERTIFPGEYESDGFYMAKMRKLA